MILLAAEKTSFSQITVLYDAIQSLIISGKAAVIEFKTGIEVLCPSTSRQNIAVLMRGAGYARIVSVNTPTLLVRKVETPGIAVDIIKESSNVHIAFSVQGAGKDTLFTLRAMSGLSTMLSLLYFTVTKDSNGPIFYFTGTQMRLENELHKLDPNLDIHIS
jgi:hypothetical protein